MLVGLAESLGIVLRCVVRCSYRNFAVPIWLVCCFDRSVLYSMLSIYFNISSFPSILSIISMSINKMGFFEEVAIPGLPVRYLLSCVHALTTTTQKLPPRAPRTGNKNEQCKQEEHIQASNADKVRNKNEQQKREQTDLKNNDSSSPPGAELFFSRFSLTDGFK